MLNDVAAIVEGNCEERFFRSILNRKCPVIYGIPNGMDSINPCVQYIKDKIKILPRSINHIFIILDRERRTESSVAMSTIIHELIADEHPASFYVGVPDRMFENWICHGQSPRDPRTAFTYPGDGCHGKSALEKMLGYSPGPTETAELLKATFASALKTRSSSFSGFANKVPQGTNYWFDR